MGGRKQIPYSVHSDAVKEATETIKGNQDSIFKYMSNGVIGWNGDDPNYMTRYVGDAIGFSDDGGASFGTAMSAKDGIVANYIGSGTMLADRIAGGILASLNGNTVFNMNSGKLEMQSANFELGNGAIIDFKDSHNKVSYYHNNHYAGLCVGVTTDGQHSQTYIGTTDHSNLSGKAEEGFNGFFANTLDRFEKEGIGNNIYGRKLDLISNYYDSNQELTDSLGFVFEMHKTEKGFRPVADNDYELGRSNNRWKKSYIVSGVFSDIETKTIKAGNKAMLSS